MFLKRYRVQYSVLWAPILEAAFKDLTFISPSDNVGNSYSFSSFLVSLSLHIPFWRRWKTNSSFFLSSWSFSLPPLHHFLFYSALIFSYSFQLFFISLFWKLSWVSVNMHMCIQTHYSSIPTVLMFSTAPLFFNWVFYDPLPGLTVLNSNKYFKLNGPGRESVLITMGSGA